MKVGSLVRLKSSDKDSDWRLSYLGIITWYDNRALVEVYWIDDEYNSHEYRDTLEVICK